MNESSKTNMVVIKYTQNGATQQNLFWFLSSRGRPFVMGLCMVFIGRTIKWRRDKCFKIFCHIFFSLGRQRERALAKHYSRQNKKKTTKRIIVFNLSSLQNCRRVFVCVIISELNIRFICSLCMRHTIACDFLLLVLRLGFYAMHMHRSLAVGIGMNDVGYI